MQWGFVRGIRDTYDSFLKLCNECSDWINGRIELLQGLPTHDRLEWIQNNLDLLRVRYRAFFQPHSRTSTLKMSYSIHFHVYPLREMSVFLGIPISRKFRDLLSY